MTQQLGTRSARRCTSAGQIIWAWFSHVREALRSYSTYNVRAFQRITGAGTGNDAGRLQPLQVLVDAT